jgi:hypothetical protein
MDEQRGGNLDDMQRRHARTVVMSKRVKKEWKAFGDRRGSLRNFARDHRTYWQDWLNNKGVK